jgi:protein TonB
MTGRAVLSCRLDVEGKTTECTTTEDPPGWGFGEAALKLAKVFKFRPTRVDDVPVAGGKMVVPINFTYPHR